MTFLNLSRLIYLDDVKNLPKRIASLVYGAKAIQNKALLASVWNKVMSTLTLAPLTGTVFFERMRQEILVLVNLGCQNKIFLRARRSPRPGFPYILEKNGGLCRIEEVDVTRYEGMPERLKEKKIDAKPWLASAKKALDRGDIEIGGYHITAERSSRLSALCFCGAYEDDQRILNDVVRNTINYAVASPLMAKISAYKGRLQLTMPVIDTNMHLHPELSLVISFDPKGAVVAVPTILRTDMVNLNLRSPDQIYLHAA